MQLISYFFTDLIIFLLFQFFIFLFLFIAICKDYLNKNSIAKVKRGEISWNYFNIFFGVMNVLLFQLINITEAFVGYKTVISIIDFFILLYLTYYNSWVRNKIVFYFLKSKEKEES
jgi:hypothetical protein